MRKSWILLALNLIALLVAGCAAPPVTAPATTTPQPASPTPSLLPPSASPTPQTSPTPTPQPRLTVAPSGPEAQDFAPGVNPLTGLPVLDPSLLELPAVLVSISNMPVTARPQAGTGFAPWVFELFIGTGTTRFMGVFYGDYPRRIPNLAGDCAVNTQIFQPGTGPWVGNRAWLDENADGQQNAWEVGVGGVCVELLDSAGNPLAATSSDSNGYFGLSLPPALDKNGYALKFKIPAAFSVTTPNLGNDDQDSDADPISGQTQTFYNGETGNSWDLGLVLKTPLAASPSPHPNDIAPGRTYVGPIRSGRLTYEDFRKMFPASCLVFASAGSDILPQLEICELVFGENPETSPNTALLDISRMRELAERSRIDGQPVNYSGNRFDPLPPPDGQLATSLWTFFHAYTQSLWEYNPLSGAYRRQTDDADGKGIFHPDLERLTGRQLEFENIIILLADYKIYRHLQYDVDLRYGLEGWAFLFRDGQVYKIRWSTANREWEQATGLLRPIHFTGNDKQPFPLKPGRTWISIMTINSGLKDLGNGQWQALFSVPNDPPPE